MVIACSSAHRADALEARAEDGGGRTAFRGACAAMLAVVASALVLGSISPCKSAARARTILGSQLAAAHAPFHNLLLLARRPATGPLTSSKPRCPSGKRCAALCCAAQRCDVRLMLARTCTVGSWRVLAWSHVSWSRLNLTRATLPLPFLCPHRNISTEVRSGKRIWSGGSSRLRCGGRRQGGQRAAVDGSSSSSGSSWNNSRRSSSRKAVGAERQWTPLRVVPTQMSPSG